MIHLKWDIKTLGMIFLPQVFQTLMVVNSFEGRVVKTKQGLNSTL